jgi:hypothetical protein
VKVTRRHQQAKANRNRLASDCNLASALSFVTYCIFTCRVADLNSSLIVSFHITEIGKLIVTWHRVCLYILQSKDQIGAKVKNIDAKVLSLDKQSLYYIINNAIW